MNPDVFIAFNRAKTRAISSRAHATLARLGGEEVSRSSLTEGLTPEQIQRDADSIRNILSVWKRMGKRNASTITLPSGRTIVPKSSANDQRGGQRENALGRPRHKRPGRS
jgi:hypothetical protein